MISAANGAYFSLDYLTSRVPSIIQSYPSTHTNSPYPFSNHLLIPPSTQYNTHALVHSRIKPISPSKKVHHTAVTRNRNVHQARCAPPRSIPLILGIWISHTVGNSLIARANQQTLPAKAYTALFGASCMDTPSPGRRVDNGQRAGAVRDVVCGDGPGDLLALLRWPWFVGRFLGRMFW